MSFGPIDVNALIWVVINPNVNIIFNFTESENILKKVFFMFLFDFYFIRISKKWQLEILKSYISKRLRDNFTLSQKPLVLIDCI